MVTELWKERERNPRVFALDSVRVPPCVLELKKRQFVTELSRILSEMATEMWLGNVSFCPTSCLLYLKHTHTHTFGGMFSQKHAKLSSLSESNLIFLGMHCLWLSLCD